MVPTATTKMNDFKTTALSSGNGHISVSTHASKPVFTALSSNYPLKLLSPKVTSDGVAIVYILGYGGGLVGGDQIKLTVDVQKEAKLVLLSQGCTKVFKARIGMRLALGTQPSMYQDRTLTVQTMNYTVGPGSSLFILPEPVTCFRNASYNQIQKFDLDPAASLVLLDSITAGRQAQDEEWAFSRYYSMNQIRVQGRLIANDVVLLEDQARVHDPSRLDCRPLRDQLAPYSCYAMGFLYGPQVQEAIQDIASQYEPMVVYQRRVAEDSIWSFSLLDTASANRAAILRVAGKDAHIVRSQLKDVLRQLEQIIGVDIYRRAFA